MSVVVAVFAAAVRFVGEGSREGACFGGEQDADSAGCRSRAELHRPNITDENEIYIASRREAFVNTPKHGQTNE